MSETRKLAAILAADVGVREHRDGTFENRQWPASSQSDHPRNHEGAQAG